MFVLSGFVLNAQIDFSSLALAFASFSFSCHVYQLVSVIMLVYVLMCITADWSFLKSY